MKTVIYQRSLLNVLLTSLFLLAGVITFNYYVDPANQFAHAAAFDNWIADALLNNKKVMFHTNYNDRGVEKIFLERTADRPDVLVIGSSRAMPINQSIFPHQSFYNASVTSASLEDYLSIYYLYQKKAQPKVLVLSIDPWILDKNHGMKKWELAFYPDYQRAKSLILKQHAKSSLVDRISIIARKYSQLLSSEYTHVALRKAFLPSAKEVIIDPMENECPSCYTRYPDGTRIFSSNQEATNAKEADLASIDGIRQYERDYGVFSQLDPNYKYLFDHFIAYLTGHGVKVIFYLPAYEPLAYSTIQKDSRYKMIEKAEQYFTAVAANYHIPVIGTYNPNTLNLQASDFVDDLHLKKQPIENIFKQQLSLATIRE